MKKNLWKTLKKKEGRVFKSEQGKMRKLLNVLGLIFIAVGSVVILDSFYGIAGFVVLDEGSGRIESLVGASLFIIGLVFLIVHRALENKVSEAIREIDGELKSGRAGTYREAEKRAIQLGYRIKDGGNHKTVYDSDGRIVTQIPRHAGEAPTGLYRRILKDLRDHAA